MTFVSVCCGARYSEEFYEGGCSRCICESCGAPCDITDLHANRINAVITIVVPLDDVGPEDTSEAKQGAATLLLSDCIDTLGSRWSDAVMSAGWVAR